MNLIQNKLSQNTLNRYLINFQGYKKKELNFYSRSILTYIKFYFSWKKIRFLWPLTFSKILILFKSKYL